MTPGARLQAAIELVAEIFPAGADPAAIPPADKTIQSYVRARRYMGSGDRASVTETVYLVIRSRARVDWHLARAGAAPTARLRVFACLALAKGWSLDDLEEMCAGGTYAAPPPDAAEAAILQSVADHAAARHRATQPEAAPPTVEDWDEGRVTWLDDPDQPDWVSGEYPEWLEPALLEAFGGREGLHAEMAAAGRPETITLRVNRLKADPSQAVAALAADGIDAAAHPFLPDALDVPVGSRVEASRAWRDGLVEVQDASAQAAARLVDARPGLAVCDYCAGAGGKSLALAATMAGQGRIVACDVDTRRLKPLARRAERAGCAAMLDGRVLGRDADPEAGAFDRVLVDAPCSGSGTWRRNPEAKWRLTPDALADLTAAQDAILDRAAGLVRPGGRLVYATCSVLPAENGMRAAAFLVRHPAFRPLDARPVWRDLGLGDPPFDEPQMLLTPARHGTDGFFAAIFERATGDGAS